MLDVSAVALALIPELENITLLVFANVISSPTDRSPTIAPDAAFTSPVMSTSPPAVMSPDVLAEVKAAAHLLDACPNTFPLALGSMLLTTCAVTFTTSAAALPITVLPETVKSAPTVALPTIAADAAFTSPVISTSFPNVPTPVTPNVVPTVAAPTIAALAAFTSPVMSTSAPAVISPEVFAVDNAAAHLLSACPKTFPFADGSIPVSYTHLTLPTTPYV